MSSCGAHRIAPGRFSDECRRERPGSAGTSPSDALYLLKQVQRFVRNADAGVAVHADAHCDRPRRARQSHRTSLTDRSRRNDGGRDQPLRGACGAFQQLEYFRAARYFEDGRDVAPSVTSLLSAADASKSSLNCGRASQFRPSGGPLTGSAGTGVLLLPPYRTSSQRAHDGTRQHPHGTA